MFTDIVFLAGFVAGTVFWTAVAFALAVYYDPRVSIGMDECEHCRQGVPHGHKPDPPTERPTASNAPKPPPTT